MGDCGFGAAHFGFRFCCGAFPEFGAAHGGVVAGRGFGEDSAGSADACGFSADVDDSSGFFEGCIYLCAGEIYSA